MTNRDTWYKRLLEIGPDHKIDGPEVYAAILVDADKKKLEAILPKLIAPYPDGEIDHDKPETWMAVHAWRLLARLHSAKGLKNMLDVADHPEDHLAYGDFAASAAAAGPEAADILLPLLEDTGSSDTRRILAVKGLVALASEHTELRDRVIIALGSLIKGSTDPDGDINGFAAEGLMALKADCTDFVAQAYKAGKIQVGLVRAAPLGAYFGFQT